MRKFLPQISLVTIFILVIGFFAVPQGAHAGVGDIVLDSLFGGTNILYGVLAKIFWWGLIPLASGVFALLGTVIDLALEMSFMKDFYNAEAISLAWGIIRDISNMFFIFILIYEGIRTVLNLGNLVTVRKTITSVIIAALFLNFSLFFTKAIIDVSNVAATWFMQGIINIGGNPSLSYSIGSTLGMEKLATKFGSGDAGELKDIGLKSFTTGVLIFVLLCVAIYVFFNFVFLIIGRIVAFIFLLITSPIGFVGPLVPMLKDYSKKWWSDLNNQAMMLPMFFLMVYITLFIVDRMQGFLLSTSAKPDEFTAPNYIIFIIIIMMLLKALKIAEEYSGEIGTIFGGLAKNATTFVAGAGLMGTVGRAAGALKNSSTLQNWASRGGEGGIGNIVGGFAARGVLAGSNATANASFGAKAGYGATLKATGLDKTSLKDQFKGAEKGYAGKIEQQVKDEVAFSKLLGKGPKGAENRERFATTLNNSLWSRSAGQLIGTRESNVRAADEIGKTGKKELVGQRKKEIVDTDKKIAENKTAQGPIEAELTEINNMETVGGVDPSKLKARKDAANAKMKDLKDKEAELTTKKANLEEAIEEGEKIEATEKEAITRKIAEGFEKQAAAGDKPKDEGGGDKDKK